MLISVTKLLFVAVGMVVLLACGSKYPVSVRGEVGYSDDARDAVYEAAFRNTLRLMSTKSVVYIAIGRDLTSSTNPPPELFRRLADVDVKLRPISELDAAAEDDFRSSTLCVAILEWKHSAEAEVSTKHYRPGGMWAHVGRATWADGKWAYHDPTEEIRERGKKQYEKYWR